LVVPVPTFASETAIPSPSSCRRLAIAVRAVVSSSTKDFVDIIRDFIYHSNGIEFPMHAPNAHRPTDSELAILHALWALGPSTVRQIQEELQKTRPTGYTTVLKLLQIMHQKGLVTRDEAQRSHIYAPAFSEEQTLRSLVSGLIDRAFGGSARQLVLQALATQKASPEELAQIKQVLDSLGGHIR
jgi:BlaI family transcriptional regulator, penicillinase repressor